jgi:hypothetical protein
MKMFVTSLTLFISFGFTSSFNRPPLTFNSHIQSASVPASVSALSSAVSLTPESNEAPPLHHKPPLKVCLMVEPTPFTHVSGYSNRFNEMLRHLSKAGDDVEVVTVDNKTPEKDLPMDRFGFNISYTQGFTFPLYKQISLSLDLPQLKGASILGKLKPDILHVSTP